MRWSPPKPGAFLEGWRLKFEGTEVNLVPEMEELTDKISRMAKDLTEAINQAEERWVLGHLTDTTLKKLIELCHREISRRKELRKRFKEMTYKPKGANE